MVHLLVEVLLVRGTGIPAGQVDSGEITVERGFLTL